MSDVETDEVREEEQPPEGGSLERIAEAGGLVPYQRPPIFPSADEFGFIMQMAEALSRGNLVPKACRGNPADTAIVLLGARDLGIPLTQAFTKLHVIEGRLTLSAELMVALALRDGHRIWCEELNGERATACAQRRGSEYVARFSFSIEDARTAELLGKDNWKKYPKAMLWARACSGVVRMELPDVTAGITYTPEEAGDDERFAAHPATALDPEVREALAARIAGLPDDRKADLRQAWSQWGLAPLSRLTHEEHPTAEQLVSRAEAIDVGEAPGAPAKAAGSASPSPAAGAQEGAQGAASEASDAEAPPGPDGPAVFNGDSGHCAECGGPIWYDAGGRGEPPGWAHADDADSLLGHMAALAGPGLDVDALYLAAHDPGARRARVEEEVAALTQTKLLKALVDNNLAAEGGPKAMREKLVEHLLAS